MTVDLSSVRPQAGAPPGVVVPARIRGTIAERLLAVLFAAADDRGDIARTLADLAAALDTSIRQVRRSARDLVDAGLVVIAQPAQVGGRYSPKVYRLADPLLTCGQLSLSLPGVTLGAGRGIHE